MAYATKYRFEFTNKVGNTYILDLMLPSYSGSINERDLGAIDPLLIKDLNDAVMGTSMEISIEVTETWGIADLYQENPRGVKAMLYQGAVSSSPASLSMAEVGTVVDGSEMQIWLLDENESAPQWYRFVFDDSGTITPGQTATGYDGVLPIDGGWDAGAIADQLATYGFLDAYTITDSGPSVIITANTVGSQYNMDLYDPLSDIQFAVTNYNVYWQGFLMPEQYIDPYIAPPFDVSIQLVDGLGLLKNIDFALTGIQTELAIIQHCLTKVGITLPLAVAINIHETNMATNRSPLSQAYLDTAIFYDDNDEPDSCYDVLQKVLQSYGLEVYITQDAGYWKIFRTIDMQDDFIVYNVAGSYQADLDGFSGYTHGQQGTYTTYPIGALTRELVPRISRLVLLQEFRRSENMFKWGTFKSTHFDNTSSRNALHWTPSHVNGEAKLIFYGNKPAIQCTRGTSDGTVWFDSDLIKVNQSAESLYFLVRFIGTYTVSNNSLRLKIQIGSYYWSGSGWTTTETSGLWAAFTQDEESEIYIEVSSLPVDGDMIISVGTENATYLHFTLLEVKLYYQSQYYDIPKLIKYKYDFSNYINQTVEHEFIGDVVYDLSNAPLCYLDVKRLSDNSGTYNWRHQSDATNYRLAQIIMRTAASNNRIPRQLLRGIIAGTHGGLQTIIQDVNNSNRQFYFKEGRFNLWTEELDGEFEELLSYSEQSFVNETVKTIT